VQRRCSRTVHRLAYRIRDGQRTAAKYQEDSHGIPDGAHTHGSGGAGLGTAILVILGAALAVKLAAPVAAAALELVHIVQIAAAVTGGVVVLAAGAAYATVRVHRWRTRGTTAVPSPAPPPWRPVQARTAPRQVAGQPSSAIEHHHHIHLHGLDAADVAAIIRHQQEGG